MKNIIQTFAAVATIAIMTGCASTKSYFIDRGRDALDIVTIGIEHDSIGVTAQAGPIMTGLNISDSKGIGLRGGHFGQYRCADMQFILAGLKFFQPQNDGRCKRFESTQILFINSGKGLLGGKSSLSGYEYGNVELSASLGIGIRAGFNILELLDFIIGWTTIDIFGDDLEAKKQRNNRTNVHSVPD